MGEFRNVTIADDGIVEGEEYRYGHWVRFAGVIDRMWIRAAIDAVPASHAPIWALQDGYGTRGYTPSQGFDWSGIRDSSAKAREKMLAVARRYLPDFLDSIEAARVVQVEEVEA